MDRFSLLNKSIFFNPYLRFLGSVHYKVFKQEWNFLACTVGLPRTGKSLFTVFTAFLLNRQFNMERDLVYTPKQFHQRVNNIENNGEIIIWDEAGIGIPAREWWKIQNQEIGKLIQGFGYKRPIVFFVTPDLSFIDLQPRKLFHYLFEVTGRTSNYSMVKPFKIVVQKRTGKIYYRYLRMKFGGMFRVTGIKFGKPPDWFIKQYKSISEPNKGELNKRSQKLMDSGNIKRFDVFGIQKTILEDRELYTTKTGLIDPYLVLSSFGDVLKESGNPMQQATTIARACNKQLELKKRGFTLPDPKV